MNPSIPTSLDGDSFAVHTTALTKRFGEHTALDNVDFTVPEGSFYVLVGPNGAGKTTLFKLLLELIQPTSGAINVLGFDPRKDPDALRASVGYVPERSEDLYAWMNVAQALAFHRRYFPAWDDAYASQLAKKLHVKQAQLQRLSKGEVRRAQLVMALAHHPPVLLLDEPSDGLDPMGREMLYAILAEHIANYPTTVVVSTHLVFELERLADHIAVLADGRLVVQTPTDNLRTRLRRYMVATDSAYVPPDQAVISINGSERERALTLWGDEEQITEQIRSAGGDIRDVRPLTLQEAAVAFLAMEHT
jgi:ABC-2 type transport system ATP-binding protein